MRAIGIITSIILISLTLLVQAAGLNGATHELYAKGDNYYLKAKPLYVIIASEINIPLELPALYGDILLTADGSGGYTLTYNPTAAQIGDGWSVSTNEVHYADYNNDSNTDLLIRAKTSSSSSIIISGSASISSSPSIGQVIQSEDLVIDISSASSYSLTFTSGGIEANKAGHQTMVSSLSGGQLQDFVAKTYNYEIPDEQIVNRVEALDGNYIGSGQYQFTTTPSGSAVVSFPIAAPPGHGGMIPQVSITYNSQSGNGLLGKGFNLSSSSMIHRCPKNLAIDGANSNVTFTDTDVLCLNGKRLMAVSENKELLADGNEYRTEIDGADKVVLNKSGKAHTLEVFKKNGVVERYTESVETIGLGSEVERAWYLGSKIDRFSNEIKYSYESLNTGEVLLKHIQYGLSEIDFIYNDSVREDARITFSNGSEYTQTKYLTNIITNTKHNGQVRRVAEYRYIYTQAGDDEQYSNLTNNLLLKSVQECGYGTTGSEADRICKIESVIKWPETEEAYAETASVATDVVRNQTGPLDWNNDGYQDLYIVTNDHIKVHLGSGAGNLGEATSIHEFTSGLGKSVTTVNLDNNAIPEFIYRTAGEYAVSDHQWYLVKDGGSRVTIGSAFQYGNIGRFPLSFDIDGDGYQDVILPMGSTSWAIYSNTGGTLQFHSNIINSGENVNGLTYLGNLENEHILLVEKEAGLELLTLTQGFVIKNENAIGLSTKNYIPVDINGDGFKDLVVPESGVLVNYIFDGREFKKTISSVSDGVIFREFRGALTYREYPSKAVDINGDGKQDLSYVENGRIKYLQSTGTNWQLGGDLTTFSGLDYGSDSSTSTSYSTRLNIPNSCKITSAISGSDSIEMRRFLGGKMIRNFGGYVLGSTSLVDYSWPGEYVYFQNTSGTRPLYERQYTNAQYMAGKEDSRLDEPAEEDLYLKIYRGIDTGFTSNYHELVYQTSGVKIRLGQDGNPLLVERRKHGYSSSYGQNFAQAMQMLNAISNKFDRTINNNNHDAYIPFGMSEEANGAWIEELGNIFGTVVLRNDWELLPESERNRLTVPFNRVSLNDVKGLVNDAFVAALIIDEVFKNISECKLYAEDNVSFFNPIPRAVTEPQLAQLATYRDNIAKIKLTFLALFSDYESEQRINGTQEVDKAFLRYFILSFVKMTDLVMGQFTTSLFEPSFVEIDTIIEAKNGKGAYDYQFLDVNGDGRLDIVKQFTATGSSWIVAKNTNANHELVKSITTASGVKLELNYSTAANENYHAKLGDLNNNLQFASSGLSILTESKLTDSNNQAATEVVKTYRYEGFRYNTNGRGFLGAEKYSVTDNNSNLKSVTEYHQQFPYIGMPFSQKTFAIDGDTEYSISETTNVWATKSTSEDGTQLVFLDNKETQSFELANNAVPYAVTTEDYDVDAYGNQTYYRSEVKTSAAAAALRTYQVDTEYDMEGSSNSVADWLVSFPTMKTESWSGANNGQDLSNRDVTSKTLVSTYEAYPNTNAIKVMDRLASTHGLPLTETYDYDSFGNVISKETKSAGETTRTEYYSAFQNNLWPTEIRHSQFGGENSDVKSSKVYDARFGTVKQSIDFSGAITNSTYDEFGRVKTNVDKQGVEQTITYNWCSDSGADAGCTLTDGNNALYSIATSQLSAPNSIVFNDAFDRTVKTKTQGFNAGEFYLQDSTYDAKGRLTSASLPYVSGSQVHNTEYSNFDVLNRPLLITQPDGSSATAEYTNGSEGRTNKNTLSITDGTNTREQVREDYLTAAGDVFKAVQAAGTDDQTTTYFDYDPQGNLDWTKVITADNSGSVSKTSAGIVTTLKFNALGNRVELKDPDTGVITDTYNPFGLVEKTKNASNQETAFTYDQLNRMATRTENEGTTSWYYDGHTKCLMGDADNTGTVKLPKGAVCAVEAPNSYSEQFGYDDKSNPIFTLNRIPTHLKDADNKTIIKSYLTEHYVDGFGRSAGTGYSSGLSVKRSYSDTGYSEKLFKDGESSTPYWQATDYSPFGAVKAYSLGNGITTTMEYADESGKLTDITATNNGALAIVDESYSWYSNNMLSTRTFDAGLHLGTETYGYDDLNRLTSVSGITGQAESYTYFNNGNIKTKTGIADAFAYGDGAGPHAVTSIGGKTYQYDARGNMTQRGGDNVVYSSFNKPTSIASSNGDALFKYTPNRSRFSHVTDQQIVYYAAGGGYEEIYQKSNDSFQQRHYIGSNLILNRNFDHLTSAANDDALEYLHRDYKDSVVAITDATGALKQRLSYKPFGERRDGDNTNDRRGFTDHEHLAESGLIHMNGRVYDPLLGRFLSPDILVQAPYNSQSYNRYSYVWNNPVSFVDPSGYAVEGGYVNPGILPRLSFSSDSLFAEQLMDIPVAAGNMTLSFLNAPLNLLGAFGDATAPLEGPVFSMTQVFPAGGGSTRLAFASFRGLGLLNDFRRVVPSNNSVTSGLIELDPRIVRTTQTTTKQQGGTLKALTESMKTNGFKVEPDKLIDVVRMRDGGLTSLDNTRIVAADLAGVKIQARVHDFDDLLPNNDQFISRFIGRKGEVPTNFGEAVLNRISNQSSLFRNTYPEGAPFISYGKKY